MCNNTKTRKQAFRNNDNNNRRCIIRQRALHRNHLVNVEIPAKDVELRVERLQQADDLHGRGRSANGRETDQVAEEHRHVVVALRFDRFACRNKTILIITTMHL